MRVLDLFSGIGGFSLGLERAGAFRTVAFCEREPFCQAVLRKHWPDTPIYDDVRTIPTDELGGIDLICGGFPCQPWSIAGQQRGAEDDRDLWPAMARLIAELRPRWVIGENVRGFVNEPMGLQRSLSDLESLEYEATAFVIPACAVDAPHRRDRVWIVANADGQRCGASRSGETQTGAATSPITTGEQSSPVADAGTETERASEGHTSECDGWIIEPSVGRVAHGVPNRVDRLKALGNAVVPQVVEQIGRAIMADQMPL